MQNVRRLPRVVLFGALIGIGMGLLSKLNASADDLECARGDVCASEGDRCLDSGNRSLECVGALWRLARPDVSGAACPKEGVTGRDACGQAVSCDADGFWADTFGNRPCP
ncbi:hypothetical protein KJ781_01940 [Patescibacteria group bacterium]|nr:hypothetical protein [Patescibacteria group bacterium]MBU1448348.1 hypothetical protein [Patescibacteria group bacterium]